MIADDGSGWLADDDEDNAGAPRSQGSSRGTAARLRAEGTKAQDPPAVPVPPATAAAPAQPVQAPPPAVVPARQKKTKNRRRKAAPKGPPPPKYNVRPQYARMASHDSGTGEPTRAGKVNFLYLIYNHLFNVVKIGVTHLSKAALQRRYETYLGRVDAMTMYEIKNSKLTLACLLLCLFNSIYAHVYRRNAPNVPGKAIPASVRLRSHLPAPRDALRCA